MIGSLEGKSEVEPAYRVRRQPGLQIATNTPWNQPHGFEPLDSEFQIWKRQ